MKGNKMKEIFDWKEYAELSRSAATEGFVLLKNDDATLPLCNGEKVSVFGRIQIDTYSAGAGSGGMVNTPYEVSVLDGLKANHRITVNDELEKIYREWIVSNPFDNGIGWAQEPYCQVEMPLSDEIVKTAANESDVALIVIGRCAGEDKDASYEKGSYLLNDEEERMLSLVCNNFKKSVVLLNVGGIMDMKWVEKFNPSAVMYIWQGGVEGGNAVADVLTGVVSPSGHLSDTIARNIEDYPSTKNFGGEKENYYSEDIYVGYRYFESVAQDKVMYPFGYGLSYTTFSIETTDFQTDDNTIKFFVNVTNTGDRAGKEVVQVYYCPPKGALGKPSRNLIRFNKTVNLKPGKSQRLLFEINIQEMASYDDTGLTGNKSCYVLEEGKYEIYVGNNVRTALEVGCAYIDGVIVVSRHSEALAPVKPFERMVIDDSGLSYVPVLRRQTDLKKRITDQMPIEGTYQGDKGYKLADVVKERITLEEFLTQLNDDDLIAMTRGEGMCSPRVTAGIAGAIGGVTDRLNDFGIPAAGCADGPAGIRMDCGTMAFSIPSGTLLACSYNIELVNRLFIYLGKEMRINGINMLLGPGMNIHRHPLNGRNFEYFSEDPYLTGEIAISELLGMHKAGVTGTLKHFAGNNQETKRYDADSIVSERALREIYLKAFEKVIKRTGAYTVMSTYGPLNGTWTAGNYDLLTTILREEWGFEGLVMTDWWAKVGQDQEEGTRENTAPMAIAQNDVYMVASDVEGNSNHDNMREALSNGLITRGQLLRGAANICKALMRTSAMIPLLGKESVEWEEINKPETNNAKTIVMDSTEDILDEKVSLPLNGINTESGTTVQYRLSIPKPGVYKMNFVVKCNLSELAQVNATIFVNRTVKGALAVTGADKDWKTISVDIDVVLSVENYIDIFFGQSGMQIKEITIQKKGDWMFP